MKRIFLIGAILAILILIFNFTFSSQNKKIETSSLPQAPSPTERFTETKASFAIFTNGTFRIFTDPRYHNLSSDVFLKSDYPNVVHVKKQGITWDEFFKTLPMKVTNDCLTTGTGQVFCSNENSKLKFYINGLFEPNALNLEIKNNDKLLVSFGSEDDQEIKNQLMEVPEIE